MDTSCPRFIRAAGGVVWRDARRTQVALVYRDRYAPGECCLPKGKLDPGEVWEEAALREVREETGCDAEIVGFAGLLEYYVRNRPKVVLYFDMLAVGDGEFTPSREVREMRWVPASQAVAALSHAGERDVLRHAMRLQTSA